MPSHDKKGGNRKRSLKFQKLRRSVGKKLPGQKPKTLDPYPSFWKEISKKEQKERLATKTAPKRFFPEPAVEREPQTQNTEEKEEKKAKEKLPTMRR